MENDENMEKGKLTEEDLNEMKYQDLRRLSILFRLPANIKKEYMVKMIQAHQEGDDVTKKSIEKKIKQDREYRKLNNKINKRGKSLMFSSQSTQQVPTDLSVSSKHEFYSYVAHYTAKEDPGGISEIIKEEAEVSRRNRNGGIVHQTRKSTRKLSSIGKREIMLPRNHSLTTPVRLMPQQERSFVPRTNGIPSSSSVGETNWSNNIRYEPISSPSESEDRFQEGSSNTYNFGNLPISGEYPNFLASSTSHELYRSQPYWHTRENCASSAVPIISNVFSSSSTVTTPSEICQSNTKTLGFQQEIYKKYIRYDSSEREFSGSDDARINSSKQNDFGEYVKSCLDDNSSVGGSDSCEQFQFRDGNSVIRHTNNQNESFVMDIYLPKSEESSGSFLRVENGNIYAPEINLFESTTTGAKNGNHENPGESQGGNSTWDEEGDECFDEKETRKRKFSDEMIQKSGSFSSDMSIVSSMSDSSKEEDAATPKLSNASKCRYSFGHNQYPDLSNVSPEGEGPLPPFITLLSSINPDYRGYSTCRNDSFTGTTPTHIHPIMTSNHAGNYNLYPSVKSWNEPDLEIGRSQSPKEMSPNNVNENLHVYPRWLYSCQEPESPYSNDGNGYAVWNEVGERGGKLMQILCRRHGCQVYPMPGSHHPQEQQQE